MIQYKFPFIPNSERLFESDNQDTNVIDVLSSKFIQYPELSNDIVTIFKLSIEKKESGIELKHDKYNLDLYYMLRIILAALNDIVLDNHVSNFFSKIYFDILEKTPNKQIYDLCKLLGINCNLKDNKDFSAFTIHFIDYMDLIKHFNNPRYNLVNQYLDKGFVILEHHDLIRLLQERIRNEILPKRIGSMVKLLNIIKEVKEINNILNEILDIQKQNSYTPSETNYHSTFSPCIQFILEKAKKGENLNHSERLLIAFFYSNAGFSIEETIDVFRTMPDFNEKKTRYYVEQSRGLKGNGIKYKMYSCNKIKTFGLCKSDCNIPNPLFNYKREL